MYFVGELMKASHGLPLVRLYLKKIHFASSWTNFFWLFLKYFCTTEHFYRHIKYTGFSTVTTIYYLFANTKPRDALISWLPSSKTKLIQRLGRFWRRRTGGGYYFEERRRQKGSNGDPGSRISGSIWTQFRQTLRHRLSTTYAQPCNEDEEN